MFGKFKENKLNLLLVKGNAESIFYNRNEETDSIETVTKEISSNIEFTLEEGQINTIKYLKTSEGKTYPPSMFSEDSRELDGFIWRTSEQPKTREDIFKKNKSKIKDKSKKVPKKRNKDITDKQNKLSAKVQLLKRKTQIKYKDWLESIKAQVHIEVLLNN